YTALSYVWGDPEASKNVTINESTLSITKNLEVALRHLQCADIHPAICIDPVCINQNDCDEKNDQIPRMSRIYSNARNVLAWLG
ncbi:heterokaryon incompatibility, partial [Setomelanomma holmii]